ncbi:F-box/kelch-repeat protein At3g06240-like [Papaver somniferum]|uniref:F-box/kelch-repeat protein At3g06240-like n=1 Tax=Papaver somniferum TaxID=3469 RepID=UPI000E701E93|nr:F-box/kelch-repeat protein At3g06240-like [Papaver somniferum]
MSGHHFPDEILLDILLRLPVKAISRFRCVSKSMCSLLQSPNFIQMHLNRSIENDKFSLLICINIDGESCVNSVASTSDSSLSLSDYKAVGMDYPFEYQNPLVEIISSCNGLVCLELNGSDVCIWNPSTTEFKKIQTLPDAFKESPESNPESKLRSGKAYTYGFGYDSEIGDYKLVRFERWEGVMYFSSSSIYRLGTNTWKELPAIHYDVTIGGRPGVHIDGILYFIAVQTQNHGDGFRCCLLILSFNVCDESVGEIDLPEGIVGEIGLYLSVFGGNLCLVCDIVGVRTDVWVMKDF